MSEIINSLYCWNRRQQTIIDAAQKSCALRGRGRFVLLRVID